MKRVIIICLFLSTLIVSGQNEGNQWYFGYNAAIDFSTTPPSILTNSAMQAISGCASVCNTIGQILFYTDGETVYNKNHSIMDNGTGLNGSYKSTQSAIIVPYPGDAKKYYIFTVGEEGSGKLSYSVVDTSANSGLGRVIQKNVQLLTSCSEKITAVKHLNGIDTWIIGHKFGTNTFYVWLLTRSGVNSSPQTFSLGSVHSGSFLHAKGYLKTNLDGTILANAALANDHIDLFDFNTSNGQLSYKYGLVIDNPYGIEFNKTNRFLYSTVWTGTFNTTKVYQFDISSNDSATSNNSKTEIGQLRGLGGAMQIAPNLDKIFFGKKSTLAPNSEYLSVINKPDSLGLSCEMVDSALKTLPGLPVYGLPNFSPSIFYKPNILISNNCLGDSTLIQIASFAGADSAIILFGDNSQLLSDSNLAVLKHKYDSLGLYLIKVGLFKNGDTTWHKRLLEIYPYPNAYLGSDTTLCDGQQISFNKTTNNAQYYWSDGSRQPVFNTNQPGNFWLRLETNGCESRDTIDVSYTYQIPLSVMDTSICPYDSLLILSSIDSIRWYDSDTSQSKWFSDNGTFNYVAYQYKCTFNDSLTISHRPPPVIYLGNDTTLCFGDSLLLFNSQENNYSYLWNTSSSDSIITITQTGSYSTIASDSFCSASDTIDVTFQEIPNVYSADSVFFCNGDKAVIDVNYSLDSLVWFDGNKQRNRVFSSPGSVYFTFDDGICQSNDTIVLTELLPPLTFTLGNDTTLCLGDSLIIGTFLPGVPLWNLGDTTNYVVAKTTDDYILSIFDSKKRICATTDTILIVFQNPENLDLGQDTTLCNEDNIALDATLSGGETYRWNTGANSPKITTSKSINIYSVDVFDGVCTVQDSILVAHYDVIQLFANDTTYCDVPSAVYTINAPNSTHVSWKSLITNEQGTSASFTCEPTNALFQVSAFIGPCVTSDSVAMNFKTTPIIGFPKDTAFCDTLMGSLQPQESAEAYFWSSGNINKTEQIESEGLVWLTANNGICTARDSVQVSFQNTPDLSFIFEDTTICESGKILELDYSFLTENLLWENGSNTGYRTFTNNGKHWLRATNNCGVDTAYMKILFMNGMCDVYIPTAFTPNGNGRNERFRPISSLPESAYLNFHIYNSIGGIVYAGTGYEGWDGMYKGKPASQDTYFYTFQYLNEGKFETREGMLQLLR